MLTSGLRRVFVMVDVVLVVSMRVVMVSGPRMALAAQRAVPVESKTSPLRYTSIHN